MTAALESVQEKTIFGFSIHTALSSRVRNFKPVLFLTWIRKFFHSGLFYLILLFAHSNSPKLCCLQDTTVRHKEVEALNFWDAAIRHKYLHFVDLSSHRILVVTYFRSIRLLTSLPMRLQGFSHLQNATNVRIWCVSGSVCTSSALLQNIFSLHDSCTNKWVAVDWNYKIWNL